MMALMAHFEIFCFFGFFFFFFFFFFLGCSVWSWRGITSMTRGEDDDDEVLEDMQRSDTDE